MKKRISQVADSGKGKESVERFEEVSEEELWCPSRWAMIQMLIPIGMKAVEEELQGEVTRLVGRRYARNDSGLKRWGHNAGSVFLGDRKVAVRAPRVRNVKVRKEIPLNSYHALQDPKVIDDTVLARVIQGISARKYERAAAEIPETFGIQKSSVSRRFIRCTARKLRKLMERDLSGYDLVAVFMDGKSFGTHSILLALGVTVDGEKVVLGFIESGTENHRVCRDFIHGLVERGLKTEKEILFIIDGSKGIRKGIQEVFGEKAVIQRCQWHKRENVVSYLGKTRQVDFRRKLQWAYERPTYEAAKRGLLAVERELKLINESAVVSLREGLEETLTLHRLGLFPKLGISFKTTNCIENVHRQLGIYTDRVSRWQSSDQRRRWVATALLEIEPRMRKIKRYKYLKELREAMKEMADQNNRKTQVA